MATVNVADPTAYRKSISTRSPRISRGISKISFLSRSDSTSSVNETFRQSRVFTIVGTKKSMPRFKMPMVKYPTGSRYIGSFNKLGFAGNGTYRYPHGVRYEGPFNDKGEFHGIGTLIYPNQQKLEGLWLGGVLQKGYSFIYKCGEVMDENLKYCTPMDRRFHIEIQTDFRPAEQEYLTPYAKARLLPPGCYDLSYGTYDPQAQVIVETVPIERSVIFADSKHEEIERDTKDDLMKATNYIPPTKFQLHDLEYVAEIPSKSRQRLIKKYCRAATTTSIGYDDKLYPIWMGGRKFEVFEHTKAGLLQDNFDYIPIDDHESDSDIKLVSFAQRPRETIKKKGSSFD